MKKHKVEIIKWNDPVSIDPWTHVDEIHPKAHIITSVGMNIVEDKEILTLALNYDSESDNYSCFLHVPKSMIVFRKRLGSV